MKRQIIIIILLILNTLIVFIPVDIVKADPSGGNIDGDIVWWENEYARLEVYPHTSNEIIRQRQWANLTWKETDNTIDVAFRFNESITGNIWRWDGTGWVDVSMQHTTYNEKHYYYYSGFNVVQDTTYRFKWMYNTTAGTSGKWDLLAKLSSDSIQTALDTGRYVCLDPWWNAAWPKRIGINIDSSEVPDTVTDFPLMVNLSGIADLIADSQDLGWDLRFVNQANDTEYYYHMAEDWESYHKTWVQIPSIASGTDTYFNCYYGNADAGQSAYYSANTVWNTEYEAVYYGNSTSDMSGNGYDFTNNGATYGAFTDGNGNALYFDGTDYIAFPYDALISNCFTSQGSWFCSIQGDPTNGNLMSWNSSDSSDSQKAFLNTKILETIIYDDGGASEYDQYTSTIEDVDTSVGLCGFFYDGSTNGMHWADKSATAFEDIVAITNYPNEADGRVWFGVNSETVAQYLVGYVDMIVILREDMSDEEMSLWGHNVVGGAGLVSYSSVQEMDVMTNAITDKTEDSAIFHGTVNNSLENEYKCGFIYGITSPVTSGNAEGNVTAPSIHGVGDVFEYNVTSLTEGELYYIKAWMNDTVDRWVYGNEIELFTYPANATSLIKSTLDDGIRLDWTHGNGYDASILLVNATGISAYPSHPDDTDGIEIYNGSNNYYEYIDLHKTDTYYFSLWEYASEGVYSEHSQSYLTDSIIYKDYVVYANETTNITEHNATLHGAFAGSSLSGNYDYGFWYGTTTPLIEGDYDVNTTIGTGTDGTDFIFHISNLDDGVTYYVKAWITNATIWETSSQEDFPANTSEPTNLTIVVNDNLSVGISWSKTYNDPATTVVVRKIDAYPSDWSDGTIIYNSTGTSYSDTPDNLAGSHWYYRVWGYVNPFSVNYSEDNIQVPPFPPSNITTTILSNSTFDIIWDNGTGARTTLVRRKLDAYPTGVTDGTQIYNSTGKQHNIQDMEVSYYYSLWSYANETYSTSVNITIGGIVLYCFDEDTNETLEFDIFISNEDGSQTHEQRNITNGYILNVSDLPLGDAVKFVVSASQNYSDQSEEFSYGVDENQTITYIVLSYSPKDKISTNVTCINESDDAHSYPPFTVVNDLVTILADDADNFTKIIVNYTYSEYQSRTYYRSITTSSFYLLNAYLPPNNLANLYLLTVSDQYDLSLEDAYIQVKNKVNNTYVIVSSLYTDANGNADLFLIEFVNYIFVISKDGYVTENASWTPGDLLFTQPFKLRLESDIVVPPEFGEIINLHGVISEDNTLTVTFYDKDDAMLNSHFYVEEYYNQTFTYMGEYNGTTSNSFTFTVDITNHSRMHIVRLYMNHSNLGATVNYTIYVMPIMEERDEGNWLENLIRSVVGDFDYGYVVTIIWVMPCILLLAGFGSMHQPGIGILGAGMWSGWFTSYLIMPNEGDILVFAGIALIVAFLVIVLKQGKKVVNE